MEKLKQAWKGMTKWEKTMVGIRDMSCLCLVVTAMLKLFGLIPYGAAIAWLLPVIAVSQALISWKYSKATALFFLAFVCFFLLMFFISKG